MKMRRRFKIVGHGWDGGESWDQPSITGAASCFLSTIRNRIYFKSIIVVLIIKKFDSTKTNDIIANIFAPFNLLQGRVVYQP